MSRSSRPDLAYSSDETVELEVPFGRRHASEIRGEADPAWAEIENLTGGILLNKEIRDVESLYDMLQHKVSLSGIGPDSSIEEVWAFCQMHLPDGLVRVDVQVVQTRLLYTTVLRPGFSRRSQARDHRGE